MTREATGHQDGLHVSDRSPASIAILLQKHYGVIFGSFLSYIASLAGFELKGAKAFQQLPGEKWATHHLQDQVILPGASIAETSPDLPPGKKIELKNGRAENPQPINAHCSSMHLFPESESILSRFVPDPSRLA
jgi:hypothetical protein